jgi:hypothetical protein
MAELLRKFNVSHVHFGKWISISEVGKACAPYFTNRGVLMSLKPVWINARRELRLGGVLVKRFRQPAKNQLSVLESFQELGWPAYIDNPLTGGGNVDARDRLHDTIRRLNNHVGRVILFMSDGLGQGITWELRKPKAPKKKRISRGGPASNQRPRSAP